MKSVRFIDFTKQNKEVDHGHWSIMHQLAESPSSPAPTSGMKSPTPNKILPTGMAFTPLDMNTEPLITEHRSEMYASSLVNDVGARLNRSVSTPEGKPEVQTQSVFSSQPAVQALPQFRPQPAVQAQPQFRPQPAVTRQPQVNPQQKVQPQFQPVEQEPSQTNFSHLFATPVDKHTADAEDAPLQSLLKRIATCR